MAGAVGRTGTSLGGSAVGGVFLQQGGIHERKMATVQIFLSGARGNRKGGGRLRALLCAYVQYFANGGVQ